MQPGAAHSLLVRVTSPTIATPDSNLTRPLTVSDLQLKRDGTAGVSASSWSTSLQSNKLEVEVAVEVGSDRE